MNFKYLIAVYNGIKSLNYNTEIYSLLNTWYYNIVGSIIIIGIGTQ